MRLEEEIDIAAPADLVWAVTVDLERWPEWTPTVRRIRRLDAGRFERGSRALLDQPGLPEAEWEVTALAPGESFTWGTRVRGMRMSATHELAPTAVGTRNVLRIEMSGVLVWLLRPLLGFSVRRALRQENAGLKRRCEELAGGG
jgi:uncharacterized membrane protein